MRYRRLGRSELKVSVVGFGCWALGGRGWGPVDDRESARAIDAALEAGVNFFDTADIYGFGHSEEVLGKALRRRPDIIIAGKVGLRREAGGRVRHDLSAEHINRACDETLRRLRRDTLDLYLIHWPDPAVPIAEALAALTALREAGKIRYIGASNLDDGDLRVALAVPGFVAYQDRLNAFERGAARALARLAPVEDVAFIGYEPLLKGLLTGKYAARPVFGRGDHRRSLSWFNEEFAATAQKVERLRLAAERHDVTPAALALALALDDATAVMPGAKTPEQARQNAAAAEIGADILKAARAELWPDQTFRRSEEPV